MFKPGQNDPPGVLGTPIATVVRVEASQNWYDQVGSDRYALAQQIISQTAGTIHSFVLGQQQLSQGVAFWSHVYRTLQWSAKYSRNGTNQLLELVIYPENALGGGLPDRELNLDGYIAWLFTDDPGGATYNFTLNGVSIYSCGSPARNSVIIFEFGATATICQSLADKGSKDFPLAPGNPNMALAMSVLPPRPRTKKFVTIQNATNLIKETIKPHDDLPLYPMFYYDNYLAQAGYDDFMGANPTVIKRVELDLNKIDETGPNKFRVHVTAPFTPAKSGGGAIVFAEFYSRKDGLRAVSQSWTKQNQLGIQVNDEPLYFAMSVPFYKTQALDFDLSLSEVDRTTPTPEFGFFDGDDNVITTGKYTNGYWRIGDVVSLQNPPANTPWYYPKTAAVTMYGWMYNMALSYWRVMFPENTTLTPTLAQLTRINNYHNDDDVLLALNTTMDDLLQSTTNSYNDDDIYVDGGALAEMEKIMGYANQVKKWFGINSDQWVALAQYYLAGDNPNPVQSADDVVNGYCTAVYNSLDDDLVSLKKLEALMAKYPNLG